MRKLLVVPALLVTTFASADVGPPPSVRTRDDPSQRALSSDTVTRYAAPYFAAIRDCYVAHARPSKRATGQLSLDLVVDRGGFVREVTIAAPGVTGKVFQRLDGCIHEQVATWHFPPRRDFTTITLPFRFFYVDVPRGGPQRSCWNKRGCPTPPPPPRDTRPNT